MSVFALKIIACISMFIDHTRFLGTVNIINTYFGRLAFPIYAFLISQGYTHTRNFAKYLGRLLLFAAISQLPAYLLFRPYIDGLYLNVFFTLALGLLAIRFYDKIKSKHIGIICVFVLAIIADMICVDYGALGVLLIAFFYILKDRKELSMIVASLILIFINLLYVTEFSLANIEQIKHCLTLAVFAIAGLIPIALYNGKLGTSKKYTKTFFYFFYPVHLLLLWLVKILFIVK